MSTVTTKHTDGPWQLELRHDGVAFGVSSPSTMRDDCDVLCEMPTQGKWSAEQINANARLIAAAPKLLEALKIALEVLESYRTTEVGAHIHSIGLARAAIAKATEH